MNYLQNEVSSARRFGGLSIVVLLHILLAYGLITGLARRMVNIIIQPVETTIIKETKPPPPEDAPPPPPRITAPPPPFVPLPEVRIQLPQIKDTITEVSHVQPPAQPFVKTIIAPVVAAALPAPAPRVVKPVPAFMDLNACKPEYPRASLLAEEQGTVRVQFVIGADSQLVSAKVIKSSGYRKLDEAAVDGLSRCKFKAAYQDGKPIQSSFMSDYVWILGE